MTELTTLGPPPGGVTATDQILLLRPGVGPFLASPTAVAPPAVTQAQITEAAEQAAGAAAGPAAAAAVAAAIPPANVVLIDGVAIPATAAHPYAMGPDDRFVRLAKTDAAASPTSLTLPAPPLYGEVYTVVDERGDCETNPATLTDPVSGATFVMNYDGDRFTLSSPSHGAWFLV